MRFETKNYHLEIGIAGIEEKIIISFYFFFQLGVGDVCFF